jgi:hypothetical protein
VDFGTGLLALEARLAGAGERGTAADFHPLYHALSDHAQYGVNVQMGEMAVPRVNISFGCRAARDEGGFSYRGKILAFGWEGYPLGFQPPTPLRCSKHEAEGVFLAADPYTRPKHEQAGFPVVFQSPAPSPASLSL